MHAGNLSSPPIDDDGPVDFTDAQSGLRLLHASGHERSNMIEQVG